MALAASLLTLSLTLPVLSVRSAPGHSDAGETVPAQVLLTPDQISDSNAKASDQAALIAALKAYWDHYLHMNKAKLAQGVVTDLLRMSHRAGGVQSGSAAFIAGLDKEWEAFERPNREISEKMTLQNLDIEVDNPSAPTTASLRYWVEIEGGSRWNYEDQGLVLMTFAKQAGQWKLTQMIDSWSLNYQIEDESPGEENFEFDFVYPVEHLPKALQFYKPLMGEPVLRTPDRVAFNLNGSHFVLDAKRLDGLTSIHKGWPNGYGLFYVSDLKAERERLKAKGVPFLAGTDTQFKKQGPDPYFISKDPAGNLFVVMQKVFLSSDNNPQPIVSGFSGNDPAIRAAKTLAESWLRTDKQAVGKFLGPSTTWFDDNRTRVRGLETGKSAILKALDSVYWARYDRGPNGLKAHMSVSGQALRKLGTDTLVSYTMTLKGTGDHAFQDKAFVSQIFDANFKLKQSMLVQNNSTSRPVLELDYTGYPVEDLARAETFYSQTLNLGKPYTDTDWRGYWSNKCVFGVYTTDPEEDQLPRPNKTNGYVSFWVHSAQETFNYLKAQKSSFPVVPAINTKSGLDSHPGYLQVYATDSEGNGVIFSEYTGRRK
jgi:extradiol dioxygenase family protein